MSYEEVMAMPIRAFWFMNSCIDRIVAQKDMRSVMVAVHRHGDEATRKYQEKLIIDSGTIVKLKFNPIATAERDEEGFNSLREMANR